MKQHDTGRVIVGVRDCLAGLQALRRAVAEARARHATLYAVRTWTMGYAGQGVGLGVGRQEMVDQAALEVYAAFLAALGEVPADIDVQVVAPEGLAGQSLVRLADRDEDLLVVGDCQRRGLRRLHGGAVARYCVRHAGCPVLVVPPPALARVSARELSAEVQRLIDAG